MAAYEAAIVRLRLLNWKRSNMRGFLQKLARLAAIAFIVLGLLICIPLLLGYFGSVHPAFDSMSNFRLHLAAALAVCAIMLLLMLRWVSGFVLAIPALAVLAAHWQQLGILPQSAQQAASGYTLLHANLRFDNPSPKEFIRLVGEVRPDVLVLNEVSAAWRGHIEALKHLYPNQLLCDADSKIGGVAVLSSRPFIAGGEAGCTNSGALAFQTVDFGGRDVMVGAAHLLWPWPHKQPLQLTDMRERMKEVGRRETPLVFASDMNAVRWSHSARRVSSFLQAAPLVIPGGTWLYHTVPADLISKLGLPIDNVFTRSVEVVSVGTLRPFGSDHLPVLVRFSLTRKSDKLTSQ